MNAKIIKLIGKFDVLISDNNKKTPTTTKITIELNDGKEKSGIVLNFHVNYSVESNILTGKLILQEIGRAHV